MAWKEIDEARFDEMLGILPPALHQSKGFLVGEPFDHRTCTVSGNFTATYAAFVCWGNRFFEGPNMTVGEFRRLKVSDVLEALK